MSFFSRRTDTSSSGASVNMLTNKKKWWRIAIFFIVLLVIVAAVFFVKAGSVLQKITGGKAGIFQNLVKTLPGVQNKLKGEEAGKINILLLGMRGENVPGGGTLADTIMVLSIHPGKDANDPSKASLVSIPRDLYVTDPGTNSKSKINAVYAYGEQREHGAGGIEDMRKVIGEVTGMDIPYAAVINFQGFIDLVNAVGGVTIHLDEPFDEAVQFHTPQVCDSNVYTLPAKSEKGLQFYECKYSIKQAREITAGSSYLSRPPVYCYNKHNKSGYYKVKTQYLLCYNHDEECGGNFKLPAGDNLVDGKTALCYSRSRDTSSDFARAARQQEVIQLIKAKALSVGTLTDFGKVNAILNSLGNNVATNMEAWEMKRLFDLYGKIGDVKPTQKVLQNSEDGLLYNPPETPEAGYILLPLGDNYDRIHALFQSLP